jgi:hypothetical protein
MAATRQTEEQKERQEKLENVLKVGGLSRMVRRKARQAQRSGPKRRQKIETQVQSVLDELQPEKGEQK